MQQEQITKILTQLANHEARIKQLEGGDHSIAKPYVGGGKQKTIREVMKGKKFKNGQEQIAAIVGYYEKVLGEVIKKDQIKNEWSGAKMNGDFSPVYFSRAKGTLIRVHPDGTCDLTQTGEEFFDSFLNSNARDD